MTINHLSPVLSGPNVPMIDVLLGMVADRSNPTDQTTPPTTTNRPDRRNAPTISYSIHGQAVLLNHWKTLVTSLVLFRPCSPMELGAILTTEKSPYPWRPMMGFKAPLQKVAHPCRFLAIFTDLFRFARHQSFTYLVYDVL
jgi:hypothetical protein